MLKTFSESWVSFGLLALPAGDAADEAASTPVWTTPGSRTSSALR
jgi:hypothetical protein